MSAKTEGHSDVRKANRDEAGQANKNGTIL
jgi:hypothetical protein